MNWFGSGPRVARLFHRLLALVFIDAFLSLAAQLRPLYGKNGLQPIAQFLERASKEGAGFVHLPTLFWWASSDWALYLVLTLGALAALMAFVGIVPRLCIAVSTVTYLSFVAAGQTFLSFQWDNMLLECGLLALFLPRHQPSHLGHFLFRLLLFKLYFESGIAKWQSPLRDWQDGSAMTFYYETAPLPTWLAFYAHRLPTWWHHLESRATLFLELVVPFAIFAPRRARLAAFALLNGFQLVNLLTANYGFFCYLSMALSVFLLDDVDLERAGQWLRLEMHEPLTAIPSATRVHLGLAGRSLFAVLFVGVSLDEAALHFFGVESGARAIYQPFRLINTYHLFGSITRERIEAEFQTFDGQNWNALEMWHKAGDPSRRPDFVAPHQPRLDFQLWFHGLAYQRGTSSYVGALLEKLCNDPKEVQGFFRTPLGRATQVRIQYWHYHFADQGRWWTRTEVGRTRDIDCTLLKEQ
jgi:hypothetical protein